MVNAGGSGINFAVCFLIYKMHNSRKKHDNMVNNLFAGHFTTKKIYDIVLDIKRRRGIVSVEWNSESCWLM